MKLKSQYLAYLLVALSTLISFQNCGQSGTVATKSDPSINTLCTGNCSTTTTVDVPPVPAPPTNTPPSTTPPGVAKDMTVTPYNDYVCEPFGSTYSPSLQGGLKARLAYLDSTQLSSTELNSYKAKDYFDPNKQGNLVTQDLFFSQIATPTREFDLGFETDDGNFLKNNQGEKLIEWFSIQYESVLKLGQNDLPGWYQLSSLTDDGSVFEIWENGQWVKLIANDGIHSNRTVCGNKAINLSANSRIKIRQTYFQGPRVRITNMVHWKYLGQHNPTAASVGDPECVSEASGGKNDSYYFMKVSTSSPSVPQQPYIDFLARGWKVIAPENYELPDKEINPCSTLTQNWIQATSLVVPISSNGSTDISLTTSLPMKFLAQVYWLDANSTKNLLTTIDQPTAATTHHLVLSGVDIERTYLIEVIFENSDYKLKKQFLLKKTLN